MEEMRSLIKLYVLDPKKKVVLHTVEGVLCPRLSWAEFKVLVYAYATQEIWDALGDRKVDGEESCGGGNCAFQFGDGEESGGGVAKLSREVMVLVQEQVVL